MIFTSVFGFATSLPAFYLMGYSAMPFYLFRPLSYPVRADVMARWAQLISREEGGIYS